MQEVAEYASCTAPTCEVECHRHLFAGRGRENDATRVTRKPERPWSTSMARLCCVRARRNRARRRRRPVSARTPPTPGGPTWASPTSAPHWATGSSALSFPIGRTWMPRSPGSSSRSGAPRTTWTSTAARTRIALETRHTSAAGAPAADRQGGHARVLRACAAWRLGGPPLSRDAGRAEPGRDLQPRALSGTRRHGAVQSGLPPRASTRRASATTANNRVPAATGGDTSR
jgi:hypothetical protein